MKFNDTLASFVSKDLKNGKVPCLLGEPGIGKSSWVESLAAANQTQCFTLPVNQLADKADLTGARLVPTPDGNYKQVFYPHEVIMDAVEYATKNPREEPILFLDEINRTTADVTSAALSIPTMRRIGSIHLPKNLKVMIAGNDKGNITSLDTASVSRFSLYRTEPDTNTFMSINQSLNVFIKNVLTTEPDLIFCKSIDVAVSAGKDDDDDNDDTSLCIDDIITDSEGMAQITTPRTISSLSDWLNEFNSGELLQMLTTPTTVEGIESNVLMEGVVAHVGYTNFAVKLIENIRVNVSTVNNTTNTYTPKPPACYGALKQQPDMASLQAYIASLGFQQISACFVYALYEKVDNHIILLELAKHLGSNLDVADISTICTIISNDDYDKENWDCVMSSGLPIVNSLVIFGDR